MPAGTARTPRRIPLHVAIFFIPGFPQREVADVFLIVFIVLHAAGRLQLTEIDVREFSVIRKFVDAIVNRFVLGLIRKPLRNQRADHLDHSVDVSLVSRSRIFVRAFDAQRIRVFGERLFELFGEFSQRGTGLACPPNRFIVHIGDVHHAMHLVTAQFEMALKQIFEDIGAKISNVRAAVNRRSAGVHTDLARTRIARLEFFDFARVSVKEAQRHLLLRCHPGRSEEPHIRAAPFLFAESHRCA